MDVFSKIFCPAALLVLCTLSCIKDPDPSSYHKPQIEATSSAIDGSIVVLSCDISGQNVSKYGFMFGEDEYDLDEYDCENLSDGKFSTRINDLKFNTDYWYNAYISGYGKNTVVSERKHLYIEQQHPTISMDPVSERTSNSVTFEYIVTEHFSGDMYACGVCWSEEPVPTISSPHKTIDGTNYGPHSTTISEGLELGKTYYARAYAINAKGVIYSNEESFYLPIICPDEAAQFELLNIADTDNDGFISLDEASKVESIGISIINWSLHSLEGIEYFTSLSSLYIEDFNRVSTAKIDNVDLEKNVNLKSVILRNVGIKSIKLPKEADIEHLDLSKSSLSASLDLSPYSNLTYLDLSGGNKIPEIIFPESAQFTYLDVASNPISSLDIPNQQNIEYLGIGGTELTDRNSLFKKMSGLKKLNAGNSLKEGDKVYLLPKLEYLDFSGSQLFSLNVSYNSKLERIIANGSRILSIDLSMNKSLDSFDGRECAGLSKIYLLEGKVVNGINSRSLDGYGIPSFTEIIYSSKIEDNSFNEYLLDNFDTNNDGYVSVLEAADVKEIIIDNAKYGNITSLHGIEMFTSLERLHVSGQRLSSMDLTSNTALTELVCDSNPLESLDLFPCKRLKVLYCQSTTLTKLNLTNNQELEEAYLFNSRLSFFECCFSIGLKKLDISCNNLSGKLYLFQNPALQYLKCSGNTTLDKVIINKGCEGTIQIEKDDHTEIAYQEWSEN